MEDSPDELSCRSYSLDIISEIDKLLEESYSDTDTVNTVKPNDLVPASTANILIHHSPVGNTEVEFIGKKRAIFELLEDHEEYGIYEHNPEEHNWTVFYKTLPPGEHQKNIKQEPGTESIDGYSTTNQQIKVKIEPDIDESNDLSQDLNNTNQYQSVSKEIKNPEHLVVEDEIMDNLWQTPLFSKQASTPQINNEYSQTGIQQNDMNDFTFKIRLLSEKTSTCPTNLNPEYSQISKPESHRNDNVLLKQLYSDKELASNKNVDPEYSQISKLEIRTDQNVVLKQLYSDKGLTSNKNVDPEYSQISKLEIRTDQNVVLKQLYSDKGLTSNKNIEPEYSQISKSEIRTDQNVVLKQLYSDKGLTSNKNVEPEYSQISKPEIRRDQNVVLKQLYSNKELASTKNVVPEFSQISKSEIRTDQNVVLKQLYSDKGLTSNKNIEPEYSQISKPEIRRDQNVVLKQLYSNKELTSTKNVVPEFSQISKSEIRTDQNVVLKQLYSDKGLTSNKNVDPEYSQISKPEILRDQNVVLKQLYSDKELTSKTNFDPEYSQISKPDIHRDQNVVLKQLYSDKGLTSNTNFDPEYSQISKPEIHRDQNAVLKQSYSDKQLILNKNVYPEYSKISKPEIHRDQNVVLQQLYSDTGLTSNENVDPEYSQINKPEIGRVKNVVLKQSYSDKGLTLNKNIDPEYSQISKPDIHRDQNVVLKQLYSDKGLTLNKNIDPEYSQISNPEICRDKNVVLKQSYSDKGLTLNKNVDPEYSQISKPEIRRDQDVVLKQSYSDKELISTKNVVPEYSQISKSEIRTDQNIVLKQSYSDRGLTSNKNVDPDYSQISKPEIRRDQDVILEQLCSDKGLTFNKNVDPGYSQISKPEIRRDQNVVLEQSYSDKGLTFNKNVDPGYSQNYNHENYNKDKDTVWKTSNSWNNPNPEFSDNYNYNDGCVDRDTKTNSEFIKWNQYKQHNPSSGSYKQPPRNHQNTYKRGPPEGNNHNKNDLRKSSKKKIQSKIPSLQCLPINQLRDFNSKSNEKFSCDFKIAENNQFGNCITYERIDSEKKNLNTGTNNSINSTFIPESVPDHTFNNFQQQHFPFIATNKSSDTSTKDIANSSLWHGHKDDNEILNLNTGTNDSKNSTFIPESVSNHTFNNFQQQNFPFASTHKPSHTSTRDITNSSLWHGHTNENEISNLNTGRNNSKNATFIPESVSDHTFDNFQQQNLPFTSTHKPSHISNRDITNSSLWHGHTNDNEILNMNTGTNNSKNSTFIPESVSGHTFDNFQQQNLPFTSTHKPSHPSTRDITNSSLWPGHTNDNETLNLNTGTNNSINSTFIPESVPDHTFNNFQQQNLPFTSTHKPSHTLTSDITNSSLWYGQKNDNEVQNLHTRTNNSSSSQFIPQNVLDHFQQQNLPYTVPHKPSHTLTSDMHKPRHAFNQTDYNKQVLNNLSLWHEHKNDNEVQNLDIEKNNSNSSQFILASVPDRTCNNFQQPKVPPFTSANKSSHASTSDMLRPRHVFDPTDFNKPKQHNQVLNSSWTEHRNINNSWKHTDSTKSLYQCNAYSNSYDIKAPHFYENQLYSNNYDIGRKEVMAPQGIDQNAKNVSVDDSSSKKISQDEHNIIKDYLCPETLVGCTVKFSSRKLANTLIREQIEEILSTHGPLENSWWTPDDLYFITYKSRDLAQYVFKLYPKNTTSSY